LEQVAIITDDDVVPNSLLDEVLARIEHKHSERKQTIKKFLNDCSAQV
jgi:hypothetical protein